MNRSFAVWLCWLFGSLSLLGEDRPNVILFIADDVSWDDYGCYGNTAARTPNIDRLASNGIRFDQAYLTASSCSPSRASIVTGRYPHNNGKAAELHLPIAANLPWFPEILRESGYYTALSGKNHMSVDPQLGRQAGARPKAFDLIDSGNGPGNSGGHAHWVQILADRPQEQPFFFWFAAHDAHRAWDADKQWDENKYGPMHSPQTVRVPDFLVDDNATRLDLASYYNEVTRFDYYIGQVVTELERQKQLDNTLLLVLADNGRPFPRAKTRLHDSGMRTGLVAHWPKGITQNGIAPNLVSAIDLAPTILAAAGLSAVPTMQGVELQPIFANPVAQVRRYAFSEHNWHDYEAHGRSVRDGHFLYIQNHRPSAAWQGPADSVRSPSHQALQARRDAGQLSVAQADIFLTPRPTEELYLVAADPDQLHNLIADPQYAKDAQRLREVLATWSRETADSIPDTISGDYFDRESGDRLKIENEAYRGTTPGEDLEAWKANSPGPR
ncbi:MAG: sulfatase [Planctomycetales bacterium]|nr:sulfatase [Planctomycetales bacterium]